MTRSKAAVVELPIADADDRRTFRDVVCTGCAWQVDDIAVVVENNQIVDLRNACGRRREWFFAANNAIVDPFVVDGKVAAYERAIARAIELLSTSRNPLVYGLGQTTTEAQRVAVALADRAGADDRHSHQPIARAGGDGVHGVGEMTCTLGEVPTAAT